MKTIRNLIQLCLLGVVLLAPPAVVQAQTYTDTYGIWGYTVTNDTITITGYSPISFNPYVLFGPITFPSSINVGSASNPDYLPVTSIGDSFSGILSEYFTSVTIPSTITNIGAYAFEDDLNLTTVTIGNGLTYNGLTYIGEYAFSDCPSLTAVYYYGPFPTEGRDAFILDNNVIFYCLGGVVDLTKPTLSITNVPAGLTVSNAAFTVMGWAADNVAVASVFYSLNNSAFTLAGTANNWANWSTNLTLTLGTNVIRAYAVDTSGNVSATNSASVNYILPLQVTTTKLPNGTNGAVYRQTLTASGGQTPYSWTNSSGTLPSGLTLAANGLISGTPTTNGTNNFTVKVTDALSATATQALVLQVTLETNPPALTITSPTSNQRWSNAVFTVTGTATDNVAVARVFYSLNSGGWSNAVTGNGWTNWTAAVTLISGTNTIAAYAMDASGNFSTTNRVSFDFVVTNQLGVRAVGLGTISPNFSNAWLEIGRNYSITSTPATGFVFTNWTVSTNWIGGAIVTGTNLQFMMQSNLTLQASFVETNKPTLTITAPTSGQHMTNAMATVTGTASDIWGVNAVWYQLTNGTLAGGTWSQAATTNNYTNWSTTLTLAAGTNMVKAYAVNLGGIYSATNSVSFVSSNSFKLQLTFANTLPLTTNGLIFSLQLSTGLNGHIQVSTNLTSWATLTNFVGTNTTINFRDPAATNSNHRFYRAVIP